MISLLLLGCSLASTLSLGPFESLPDGQSQAIAAAHGRLVTLNGNAAVWWEAGAPVTAGLPGIPVDGALWDADGAGVRVGPGHLDLTTRVWTAYPALAALVRRRPTGPSDTLRALVWAPDAAHAAALVEPGPGSPGGRRPPAEVQIHATGPDTLRARIPAPSARAVVFAGARIAVGSDATRLYDLDGALTGEVPGAVARLRSDGRTLVVVGLDGRVTLVDPADARVIGVLQGAFVDAAVDGALVVGVDLAGNAHAACRPNLDEVTTVDTGTPGPVVALDGAQVIVAGAGGVRAGAVRGCPG